MAQHCILCAEEALAEGLPIRTALACLLHDASEIYLSDVPRPFKKTLSGYYELEDRILTLVYKKFLGSPLTMLEEEEVKRIDDLVLYYDLINLLNEIPNESAPPLAVELDYSFKSFDLVEKRYLEFFAELQNKL